MSGIFLHKGAWFNFALPLKEIFSDVIVPPTGTAQKLFELCHAVLLVWYVKFKNLLKLYFNFFVP